MEPIKRYDPELWQREGKDIDVCMVEHKHGIYVAFFDHAHKIAALERRLRIAWKIIGKLVDVNTTSSHELFQECEREIDAEEQRNG